MRKYSKLIAAATIAAALAVPAVSSAAATTNNASCEGANHGTFASVYGVPGPWLGPDGGASDKGTTTGQMPHANGYNNSYISVCH